jgi:uncharacterized protein
MITRNAQATLEGLCQQYPVVTMTGPRQSGKTTLCKMAFPDKAYASLEATDVRQFALEDPRGFLRQFPEGAILDEIQRAPDLTSYLQGIVDETPTPGRFVLTGSRNLAVREAVSQSLAGRTAILELLPLCLDEWQRFPGVADDRFEIMLAGGYPAIPDRGLDSWRWLDDYLTTYVERDVRQVMNIGDLSTFQTFMRLCAGRAGQLVNLTALGADAGVSHNTARTWLSVLEAGYITYRLPPWYGNVRKRLVKTPKLYFYDTGLLCHLLGMRTPDQLRIHPLRGAIFENWVITEVHKAQANSGETRRLYFYRDRAGLEVDLVIPDQPFPVAAEIKSGETVSGSFFTNLHRYQALLENQPIAPLLVYGGDDEFTRSNVRCLPWSRAADIASM